MNNDTLFCIFEFLNAKDIISCSLVNNQFYIVSKNDILWESLFVKKFYNIESNGNYQLYKTYDVLNNFLRKFNNVNHIINLQCLDLNWCGLKSIPKEIGQLTNLQTFVLHSNRLKSIPKEIGQLTNLQTLFLHSNHLKSIPKEIGYLTNLQTL